MSRIDSKSHSMNDRIKQNWIQELEGFGVTGGPNGESLQSLDYYELRGLVLKEHMKRE